MHAHKLGVAAWRRIILVGITALIALLALSYQAPTEAHAVRDPNQVLPSHKGWVYLKGARNVNQVCTLQYPSTCSSVPLSPLVHTAYAWTGKGWAARQIHGGTQVYAYPFSGEWHWIWTARTGWLAIQTNRLDTGYVCQSAPCPVF